MTQKNKTQLLKVSLIIFAVITLVYGVGYLLFPQFMIKLSGGVEVSSAWLRWPGGTLVALGIGAILVYNDLEKQNTLIITFALGMLLTGLALLYSLFFDSIAKTWFAAIPAIVSLISSALLWYARSQAKHILKKGKSD